MVASVRRSDRPGSDIARRRTERRLAGGRRSDARWREVLDGAARVFHRLGYAQATLEDVATEVGVNRATLYYYVGTKEELLVALLHEPVERMRAHAEGIAAQEAPAGDRLAQALRGYARAMAEHPEMFVFVSENLHKVTSGRGAAGIQRNADRYARVLAGVVAEGARSGEFRDDLDPHVAVLGILGMFGWVCRWYDPAGAWSLPEIGETFVELALSGLAPRPPG